MYLKWGLFSFPFELREPAKVCPAGLGLLIRLHNLSAVLEIGPVPNM